jgi:NADPH:quinone reductase-like Zn-dependent oxidoreductase
MQAVIVPQFGGPEVLTLEERPLPEIKHDDVLIRVRAIGVNPVDHKTRSGQGVAGKMGDPPFIVGWDVAGEVVDRGRRVTDFEEGDRVAGMVNFPAPGGGYAKFVRADTRELVRIPEGVSFQAAAGLPLAGLTAYQALFDVAKLRIRNRLLIHGAAGGVGHLAVQLAREAGCEIIGTASPRNRQYLEAIGVDQVIDYHDSKWETAVDFVDAVLDPIGGETRERSLSVLARHGVLVALTSDARNVSSQRVKWMLVKPQPRQLAELMGKLGDGTIRVTVTTVSGLTGISQAHVMSQSGHVRGKVVVEL